MEQKINDGISKFLSYVLRHNPDEIKISLDKEGWVNLTDLVNNSKKYAEKSFTKEDIVHVVETNAKQRFQLSDDLTQIRANQGHTVEVFLDLPDSEPPEFLYHGTAERFLEPILKEGLKPMKRHDVHLSYDTKIAVSVGQRYGKPVILKIKAKKMFDDGFKFKCTRNNVWLTKSVPPEYFEITKH